MPSIAAIPGYRLWWVWYGNTSTTAVNGGVNIKFMRPAPWGDTMIPWLANNSTCSLNEGMVWLVCHLRAH